MKKLVYSLVILTLCSCLYGAEITRNGKAVADIAIPDNAVSSVKFAAEELQKFIKIVSGAKLDIVKESSPRKFKNRIYLGSLGSLHRTALGEQEFPLKRQFFISRTPN